MHVPFCRVQCPYCTFYTVLKPQSAQPMRRFLDAVWREWQLRVVPRLHGGDRLRTLYLGGGTPSDVPADALAQLLRRIGTTVPGGLAALDETTIECNPESADDGMLDTLQRLGVGRVSLGVQALDEVALRRLGRAASLRDVRRALRAVASRFSSWNADLILGVPGSSEEQLVEALAELHDVGAPHLSFYCLELPATRAPLVGDALDARSDALKADLYESASSWVEAHGYEHYEISNAARPGHRALHNTAYWEGRDYVGLGPGAHSFEAGARRVNQSGLDRYCAALEAGAPPPHAVEQLTPEQRRHEQLLLGLRQRRGVDVAAAGLETRAAVLEALTEAGLGRVDAGRFQLTARGWLVSDSIVLQLVAA